MIDAEWVRRYIEHYPVRWTDVGDRLVHEGASYMVWEIPEGETTESWAAEFRSGSRIVYAAPRCHRINDHIYNHGRATEAPISCLVCLAHLS